MEILEDIIFPKRYWAVGSSYGGVNDQTEKFIAENIWIEGWGLSNDSRNIKILDKVQTDDILIMKSSATKGPGRTITFTKIKAIGLVIEKINYYTFSVKWYDTILFPLDFDGLRYGKTIQEMRNDEMLNYVKNFITQEHK